MADMQILRQPTTVWEFENPTLFPNQLGVCSDIRNGVETDTGLAKLGDGLTAWDDLPIFPTANLIEATIDCSANPNYPASTAGELYLVSVAGLIGGGSGVSVTAGDFIFCTVTNGGGTQAAVGDDFEIIHTSLNGDVVGPASSTDNAVARFDSTTGKLIQNSAVTVADTTGNISGPQKITLGTAAAATGSIELNGTTSGTVTVKPADAAGTWTLTLPANDGDSGQYLQTNGSGVSTWAAGATGDVVGPASATDNAIVRFDGTTGKLVQNSAVTIADTNGAIIQAQGTLTTSNPAISHTATWNNGAVVFTNILSNVTATAADSASMLIDLQVGGASRFNVRGDGLLTASSGVTAPSVNATTGVSAGAAGVEALQGTLDGGVPGFNHTVTWDEGGTTFTAIKSNVTNTASDAASKLIDLQVGGTSRFNVTRTGVGTLLGGLVATSGTFSAAITSSSATDGVGYATGAGGAVTQATNRTTGVTLNTVTGAITLVSAAGSATAASFTVTNSAVEATDTIIVNQKSGTDLYIISVTNVAAGSFRITSYTTGGTTTEQPVFNFAVIKGVAA